MHELSLANSVMEILESQPALAEPGARLRKVEIEAGPLSGVEPGTFVAAMDSVLAGSGHEGARTELLRQEASAECLDCGHRFAPLRRFSPCPACNSAHTLLVSGTEFRLVSFTLERE